MKRTIAALIAGIMLGTTGLAAGAVMSGYWKQSGNFYSCQGVANGVLCKERNGLYGVSITPSYVAITRRGKAIRGCERGYGVSAESCFP